jgi:hypothetical protein
MLPIPESIISHRCKSLDSRDFVSDSSVVATHLRLYENRRIKFIRHKEVGSLLKTGHPFSPFSLSKRDSRTGKPLLYRLLHYVAY